MQFLLFSTIFTIYLQLQESKLRTHLLNVVVDLFFPIFCKSDMSKYGYLEVFQRVPWNSR